MKQKKIIILGGSGFIGGQLFSFFRNKNENIVQAPSSRECNLLDPESISRTIKTADRNTFLIICAAIGRLQEDSFDTMNKNCAMAHNLVSQKFQNGLGGIIFMSSVDIYGRPPDKLPIDEKSYPKTDSYYSMSKYISEMLLKKGMKGICPVTILRLPGVYGYHDGYRSIVGRFIKQALEDRLIKVFGDGNQKRDYIAVEDLCQAVEILIKHPVQEIFNLVTGKSYTLNDIVEMICAHLPETVNVLHEDNNKTDCFNLLFSNAKLMQYQEGFSFRALDQGIIEYINRLNPGLQGHTDRP